MEHINLTKNVANHMSEYLARLEAKRSYILVRQRHKSEVMLQLYKISIKSSFEDKILL